MQRCQVVYFSFLFCFFLVFFYALCVKFWFKTTKEKSGSFHSLPRKHTLSHLNYVLISQWFEFFIYGFFLCFCDMDADGKSENKTWSQNRKVRGEKTKLFALGIFLVAIGYPLKLFGFFSAVILDFDFFLVAYLKIIPFFCHSEKASGRSYLTFLRTGRWFDLR